MNDGPPLPSGAPHRNGCPGPLGGRGHLRHGLGPGVTWLGKGRLLDRSTALEIQEREDAGRQRQGLCFLLSLDLDQSQDLQGSSQMTSAQSWNKNLGPWAKSTGQALKSGLCWGQG